jgi:hypothetical protein
MEVIAVLETWLDGHKKCIELHWEYVEQIPSLVTVACFLPVWAKDLSAPPFNKSKESVPNVLLTTEGMLEQVCGVWRGFVLLHHRLISLLSWPLVGYFSISPHTLSKCPYDEVFWPKLGRISCLPHANYMHTHFILPSAVQIKGKAIPLQARTGPEGSRRLRLPDSMTIGTWRWRGCQPYAPAAFTPRKYSWYCTNTMWNVCIMLSVLASLKLRSHDEIQCICALYSQRWHLYVCIPAYTQFCLWFALWFCIKNYFYQWYTSLQYPPTFFYQQRLYYSLINFYPW